jgi:hypothetical protein
MQVLVGLGDRRGRSKCAPGARAVSAYGTEGNAAETFQAYESSTARTFRSNAAAVNGLLRKGICASNTPCRTTVSLV